MPIQDIKRSEELPSTRFDDPVVLEIYNSYSEVSQQLNNINARIQQFEITIANGSTANNVVLNDTAGRHPTYTTEYYVGVQFSFNSGGYWVTAKTTTGFTITWVGPSPGAQSARVLIVE